MVEEMRMGRRGHRALVGSSRLGAGGSDCPAKAGLLKLAAGHSHPPMLA